MECFHLLRYPLLIFPSVISSYAFCEIPPPAYQQAAQAAGIPAEVLYAVAKVESNFKIKIGYYPWPWTLNIKGQGAYFATRAEACAAALQGIERYGRYGVDIGLTQQNWGYVGMRYYSHPCDALAPLANLNTAALELRRCYDKQERDWVMAAGCYHRPAGGEPARLYRQQFLKKYQQVLGIQ